MICVPISKVLPNGPKIWSEKKLVVVASMDFWNIQKNKSGLIVVDLLCNHFTSGSKKSVTKSNYWPIYIMVHNGENQPMDRFYYRHFWTGHYKNVQIETLKTKILIFWIVTHAFAQDYWVSQVFWDPIKNHASPRSTLLEAVYLEALL